MFLVTLFNAPLKGLPPSLIYKPHTVYIASQRECHGDCSWIEIYRKLCREAVRRSSAETDSFLSLMLESAIPQSCCLFGLHLDMWKPLKYSHVNFIAPSRSGPRVGVSPISNPADYVSSRRFPCGFDFQHQSQHFRTQGSDCTGDGCDRASSVQRNPRLFERRPSLIPVVTIWLAQYIKRPETGEVLVRPSSFLELNSIINVPLLGPPPLLFFLLLLKPWENAPQGKGGGDCYLFTTHIPTQ